MSAPGGDIQEHQLQQRSSDGHSPTEPPQDIGSPDPVLLYQQRGGNGLPSVLAAVATLGWESAAGRDAIAIMRRACRREAMQWTRTAGWLTDEGLATVWEQMDRVVRTGRYEDAPGLLRVIVKRAYAGEAAAAQTGFGSPTTRGLIGAIPALRGRPDHRAWSRGCDTGARRPPHFRCAQVDANACRCPRSRRMAVASAAATRGHGICGRCRPVWAPVPVRAGRS